MLQVREKMVGGVGMEVKMSELAERAMKEIRTALTLAGIKHRIEEGWASCEIKVYISKGNEEEGGRKAGG